MKQGDTWSTITLDEIKHHIDQLIERAPALDEALDVRTAYGSKPGPDVTVLFKHPSGVNYYLLIEIEQYASGSTMESKVKSWAKRHFKEQNTTTVVVSLVLQALRNRLVGTFSKYAEVKDMVFSKDFRLFPGRGDGHISDEFKVFISTWIEDKLMR